MELCSLEADQLLFFRLYSQRIRSDLSLLNQSIDFVEDEPDRDD